MKLAAVKHAFAVIPLLLTTAWSHAATEFATFPIPTHVESEHKGLFIELTREAARRAGEELHINVVPPLRAIQGFFAGTYGVLFPALDINFAPGQTQVRTQESIDCKEDFVFTRKGQAPLTTLDDLKGKRVGLTRGYPYASDVNDNKDMQIEMANSDETNIRKLIAGHLDAFVLDEKTGITAFERLGLSAQMQYEPKRPVSRQDVFYAFQNTAEGKQLAQRFSKALAQMKADGSYQRITRGITIGKGCPAKARP